MDQSLCCTEVNHEQELITGVCIRCNLKQTYVCSLCLLQKHKQHSNYSFISFIQIIDQLQERIFKIKMKKFEQSQEFLKLQDKYQEMGKKIDQEIRMTEQCIDLLQQKKYMDDNTLRIIQTLKGQQKTSLVQSILVPIQQRYQSSTDYPYRQGVEKLKIGFQSSASHLQQEKCLKLARKYFEILTLLDKKNYRAMFSLGTILMEKNKHKKAQQYFENAIEMQQDLYEPELQKGICLRKQGLYNSAMNCFQVAQSKFQEKNKEVSGEIEAEIGKVLLKTLKIQDALERLSQNIHEFPDCEKSYIPYIKYLISINEFNEAQQACTKMLQNIGNSKLGQYYKGLILLKQGQITHAQQAFEKLLFKEQDQQQFQLSFQQREPEQRLMSENYQLDSERSNQQFWKKC